MKEYRKLFLLISILLFGLVTSAWMKVVVLASGHPPGSLSSDINPTPTPAYDPLEVPVLPEHPSAVESGKYLYYFHCMPCHGDRGQGLTPEWRQVWVEDHQNCWGRGCHGGKASDEGFPIPKFIPAVIFTAANKDQGQTISPIRAHFASIEELSSYLASTHPPQEPGRLKPDEYQALSAYLWVENSPSKLDPASPWLAVIGEQIEPDMNDLTGPANPAGLFPSAILSISAELALALSLVMLLLFMARILT